ncbi:MAG: hypothetical protein D5R99_03305 [Methanocalculus sp. MSAO_Arc1]|uniref:V-type ATP synthase subunit F n=1 Tax=Methanocalculus TaxID=71151 RepID=UPI000FF39800|nr:MULTISPECIES: V-type ATP synthase subunit F [unclassified Methanocalculus]MCP1661507.1 vacuolar-type H+-ATPase subunit F/Vma7 [Methanocalculus sp. AMF5]RQD80992.1 MAG: hypothetical protein D5R99_03305 [Methanocalculus sp. MSAO_Arc1]
MRIVAIGDFQMALLCRLGGVSESLHCDDAESAEEELKKLLQDDSVGVILILDRFMQPLLPLLDEHGRSDAVYPVIIGVPGSAGPSEGEDSITQAIRRVAGKGMPE